MSKLPKIDADWMQHSMGWGGFADAGDAFQQTSIALCRRSRREVLEWAVETCPGCGGDEWQELKLEQVSIPCPACLRFREAREEMDRE